MARWLVTDEAGTGNCLILVREEKKKLKVIKSFTMIINSCTNQYMILGVDLARSVTFYGHAFVDGRTV